jgi:aspartate beta-hydroxylase
MTDSLPTAVLADEAARALWAGDVDTAVALYQDLTAREPGVATHWVKLAAAVRRAGDREAELAALDAALAIEPRLLTALLLKGANLEDRGQQIASGQVFKAALTVAPPPERLPANLIPHIQRAQASVARHQAAFEAVVRRTLSHAGAGVDAGELERFNQSVDVLLGKKPIYRQHPNSFYFPGLPETQFYPREQFPWLTGIEQATDAIREEFEAIWRSDVGSEPYISYPPTAPIDQWAELNNSVNWSAFHLLKNGAENPVNLARCPRTAAEVAKAPAPGLPSRSPNAMFSVLKPRTRIPPHTGETNVRLVVHIPLIIPGQTGFRVGNDTRPWRVGEAFVFNDTIEHEAWNDSAQMRAILMFDIWHPDLSPVEREMIVQLMAATDEFLGGGWAGL